jgi:hypothetical protein
LRYIYHLRLIDINRKIRNPCRDVAVLRLYMAVLRLYMAVLRLYMAVLRLYMAVLRLYMAVLRLYMAVLRLYMALLRLYNICNKRGHDIVPFLQSQQLTNNRQDNSSVILIKFAKIWRI